MAVTVTESGETFGPFADEEICLIEQGIKNARIMLMLVIPSIPNEHLPHVQDGLRQVLSVDRRLWAIRNEHIIVANRRIAARMGLISG